MSGAALILHDDEPTSSLLRGLLESAGYVTAGASTSYRLLALDVEGPARLVLLGMTALEDRDVELVALLRKRWPDTWIVALYPSALRERAALALTLGADSCLPEPFYAAEILAIAKRAAVRSGAAGAPSEAAPAAGVDQLAAGVAHMIRNPLQVMSLQLETAGDEIDAKGMREQIARIEGVVEDLLRCGGRRDASRAPVDVAHLVEQVFGKGRKKGAGPTILVKSADETAEVLGSAELLKDAVETLRRRAERVTPHEGRIEVRTQVRDDGGRRVVEVYVTDGGPRLPDARRARLFDPFPDAAAMQEGTGLELAAVAGIVRGHGGTTSAHASADVGTTIVLRLPAKDADAARPKAPAR